MFHGLAPGQVIIDRELPEVLGHQRGNAGFAGSFLKVLVEADGAGRQGDSEEDGNCSGDDRAEYNDG